MTDLKAGIYRHYKGPLYLVLGLAHDANADDLVTAAAALAGEPISVIGEREVVVYVGLELEGHKHGARLAVRTLEDFFAEVCGGLLCGRFGQSRGGCPPEHGVPRFKYLGPRYEGTTS